MRTAGLPVRIRGVTYPSHRIAARALGVSERTLRLALDAGRVDQVGLRRKKGGAPGVPCVYRGQEYPSQIAAALACNVSTNSVYRAVRKAKGGRISLPRQPDRLKLNGPGSVTSAHPGPDHGDLSEEIAQMADTSQYPDSAGKGNTNEDSGMDEGFMAESLDRVLRYGIPFRIYAEAFQREDGDPNPLDTSCILDALVAAAIWGAANGREVLTTRQVEQSDQQAYDFDGDQE